MKIKQAIKQAIETHNPAIAGTVVDLLRFNHGMNYGQILKLVQTVVPGIDPGEWDVPLWGIVTDKHTDFFM